MIDVPEISNPQLFVAYAQSDPEIWQMAVGQQVTHTSFGVGTIKNVEFSSGKRSLEVCFLNDQTPSRPFTSEALANAHFFHGMQLPNGLQGIEHTREQLQEQIREQNRRRMEHEQWLAKERLLREEEQRHRELERQKPEEQRHKEQTAAQEFSELKVKHLAESHEATSPSSTLYPILLQIDDQELLDDDKIDWLKRNSLWGTLAIYFQNEYRKTQDVWALVKASAHWRDAGQPDKAIKLTDYLLGKHSLVEARAKSAILTTRGGAYRDVHDLSEAEWCAREAIRYNEMSFQPYNLLGAIYFERGEAEKGEACFLRALELGAPSQAQEVQMQGALKNAGEVEQKAVAQYLLQRDPIKYKWAEYYL
jgi:hypothetical protein